MIHRELTRTERAAIRRLVKGLCANYDNEYGCLLLEGDCYMFYGVAYTNTGMCKYFRNAVLPTDPVMETIVDGRRGGENAPMCPVRRDFPHRRERSVLLGRLREYRQAKAETGIYTEKTGASVEICSENPRMVTGFSDLKTG